MSALRPDRLPAADRRGCLMSAKPSKKQKQTLLDLRARLVQDLEHLGAGLDLMQQEMAGEVNREDRIAEIAALVQNQETGITLQEHLSELLNRVDAALEGIEAGTYGVCVSCGHPIPAERLAAVPYAERCVDCQRKQEKR